MSNTKYIQSQFILNHMESANIVKFRKGSNRLAILTMDIIRFDDNGNIIIVVALIGEVKVIPVTDVHSITPLTKF